MPDRLGHRPRPVGNLRAAIEHVAQLLATAAVHGLATMPSTLTDPVFGWIGRQLVQHYRSEPPFIAAELACPRPVAVGIAAGARANWQRAKADFLRTRRRPAVSGRVRLHGEHHLRAAYAQGNGVVLATAHTTALLPALWSTLQLGLTFGYRLHAVGNVALGDAVLGMAGFAYTKPRPAGVRTSRALLGALVSGAALLMPVDVLTSYGNATPVRRRWVKTQFLGSQAVFSTGAATLARLAGAPIVPTIGLRTGPGQYAVIFLQAIPPATDRRRDRDVMHRVLATLETVIRTHPDQYCWWLYAWAPPADPVRAGLAGEPARDPPVVRATVDQDG